MDFGKMLLEDELGGAADKAAERLDAATNRINNAWERLKRAREVRETLRRREAEESAARWGGE